MSATLSCHDCGSQVRPTGQSFCDVCGAFLKWGPDGTADGGGRAPDGGSAGAPGAAEEPGGREPAAGPGDGGAGERSVPAEREGARTPSAGTADTASGATGGGSGAGTARTGDGPRAGTAERGTTGGAPGTADTGPRAGDPVRAPGAADGGGARPAGPQPDSGSAAEEPRGRGTERAGTPVGAPWEADGGAPAGTERPGSGTGTGTPTDPSWTGTTDDGPRPGAARQHTTERARGTAQTDGERADGERADEERADGRRVDERQRADEGPADGGRAAAAPATGADPARRTPPPPPVPPSVPPRGGADAARALLVPVPEATAPVRPPGAPGEVLPARPQAPRPRRSVQVEAAPEEGRACFDCGTANGPHRHFCRGCAAPLDPRTAERPTGPYAGQRPPLPRARRRWVTRTLIALGVTAAVVGAVAAGPPAVRAVQDHFAKRVAVRPDTWNASHADREHDVHLAFDGYSNTWFGTGYAGDSAGQYLEASFGQPTDLLALIITPGTSKRSGQRSEQARPQEFDLLVTDSSGRTRTSRHHINDGGAQKVRVRVRDAVTVRLVIRSAYGAAADRQVAIAEMEFFGRSASRP